MSKIFKIEVTETAKTFKVLSTPYQFYRTTLNKSEEYQAIGGHSDFMYGTDKGKLIEEWVALSEIRENKEVARHFREMEEIRARLSIEEEI